MSSPPSILLVDPDPSARRWAASMLENAGFDWREASDGAAAIEQLADGGVQGTILSLALPASAREAISVACVKAGAILLGSGHCEGSADPRDESLRLGARGYIADKESVVDVVQSGLRLRRESLARREDYQRIQFQYEQLREHCAQQAESFRESQETFYLDLSRMMTIIGNIMDGIVFVDGSGNISLLNPVAEDMLGVKAFLAIGKPLAALAGGGELLEALAADHERVLTQKESSQVVEVHHSDQDLLYIKLQTSRVLDYRGQQAGVLSVIKDVTAEHKTDQLKNQYLSIVAHELRTPLTGIKTFATMMMKGSLGDLNETQNRVIESIREQSLRLEHQIDKLINLGHLEANQYGQDLEVFNIVEFVAAVIAPFEQAAKDRQIELTSVVPDVSDTDDLRIHADRDDLRRACQALVENAVKFTPEGGSVEIRIDLDDEDARIVVEDDGIGIDPRYHRRIFEKFFQVEDPLTRHHGGAGLGLFVAQGIVEAHGSEIVVESTLGNGASFSFGLPIGSTLVDSETPGTTDTASVH